MSSQQLENLSVADVASLTNKQVDEVKEYISNSSASPGDLKQVIKAEEAGKDRDAVKQFLKEEISKKSLTGKLDTALNELEELEEVIKGLEDVEDIDAIDDDEKVDLDQNKIVELAEGTVKDMKKFINNHELYKSQLESILDAEKSGKDRKTAKRFLEKRIGNKTIGNDLQKTQDDLYTLKEDLENLQEQIQNTNASYNIQSDKDNSKLAKELINITNNILSELKENKKLAQDQEIQKLTNDVLTALDQDNYQILRKKLVNLQEKKQEKIKENKQEQDKEPETKEMEKKQEQQNNKLDRMKQIVENIETTEQKIESKSKDTREQRKLKEKKKIAKDLKTNLTDEELKEISKEELRDLKREEKRRERLINKLIEEGLEREELEQSSTADLKKLEENVRKTKQQNKVSQDKKQAMQKEAQEELNNLMGAQKSEENQQTEQVKKDTANTTEKLGSIKKQIRQKFEHDDKAQSDRGQEVVELLESYRDLEPAEASIKIAHVMKSYLENELAVEREMTYQELANTLPEDQHDEMSTLRKFFEKMNKQEYTNKIEIENHEPIIDSCQKIVKEL